MSFWNEIIFCYQLLSKIDTKYIGFFMISEISFGIVNNEWKNWETKMVIVVLLHSILMLNYKTIVQKVVFETRTK